MDTQCCAMLARMGSSSSRIQANGTQPASNRIHRNGNGQSRIPADPQSVYNEKQHMIYQLVDMHGGGELIKWMRYAKKSGDYSIVEGYIETAIKELMYNEGKGKLESVAELVKIRNKERNDRLAAFLRKKGKGKSGPNILDHFNQEGQHQGDLKKALKLLDGGKSIKGDARYRYVVWKFEQRGSMGENLVGCCLMQGTPLHNELAIRLMKEFPKLINDIFISEDYYGLSPLHLAIVNENPGLVNFLLQHGADINQRCYGAFFCPDDQIGSRTDSMEHEYVELSTQTNYTGRMYYGEYPLAFAACTNQLDCYRLLRAKKADPNRKDTNGNTVLHMTVIHENMEMLKLVCDTGGKLDIMNNQKLTPMTLAAKLAKKNMFQRILQLESNTVWNYGQSASVAYPLARIDTINQETGQLNEDSALSLVVYGESMEHLDLLDGLLEDLLKAKWQSYGRTKWIISLLAFCFYYAVFSMAFMNRDFSMTTSVITHLLIGSDGHFVPHPREPNQYMSSNTSFNATSSYSPSLLPNFFWSIFSGWYISDRCHLWRYDTTAMSGQVRMMCEPLVLLMVMFQMASEVWDIHNIGYDKWWRIMKTFPSKTLYKSSFFLILALVPVRFMCGLGDYMLLLDNMLTLLSVIFTTFHFLYYLRAIKFVGPFILMIYTIISRDMARFFVIYLIFLVGFSQGFYVVFHSCERERQRHIYSRLNDTSGAAVEDDESRNIIENPFESILRLFIMTVGEFTVFYRSLQTCQTQAMSIIGKIMFIAFMMVVYLMQFNMLIAMMTRTYELIFRTQKEWKRQWAQVILMLELSVHPKQRLMALLKYSKPIGSDVRKRAFVVTRKIDSNTEVERLKREQRVHTLREEKKLILKRRLKDAMTKEERRSGLRPWTSYFVPTSPIKQFQKPTSPRR
ncbi:ankyrin repeats (3 copies) domain-containing protein [Ditylenchus destructor]|uniref:Ankyrin repeats (3 copies) domain-containing protein n=1 Tax=Ditylenchus destructor TaxID=166010 RepID=A0AAD4R041_9BILA|nr:ankyrin repeats (3 copies) domain-containing protein [Ditylenchus destructor]